MALRRAFRHALLRAVVPAFGRTVVPAFGRAVVVPALLLGFVLAGCTGGAGHPILANEPAFRPSPAPVPSRSPGAPDPVPVAFPRDDGPHDRLTEWWYYTGHLRDRATGDRYGFELVVFRAERGDFPVSWASHVAITDETHGRFLYAQRSEIGPQVAQPAAAGFSLALSGPAQGVSPPSLPPSLPPSWTMVGANGTDAIDVALATDEARPSDPPSSFALQLSLAATKPPTLHGGNGFVDFGPAGGSYYYSRTRMTAAGRIAIDGRQLDVDGTAWFDHQWGDFIAVGGGGWDWYAVNLDDGTDVTLSLVRDASGGYPLVYGTLDGPTGATTHLAAGDFSVTTTGHWQSPLSGTTYPSGWRVRIPAAGLVIELSPTVAAQELDTRASTGVVYWEGSQVVRATERGRPVGGEAYVELTGYSTPAAPSGP
jgi:predicted secreted hydrolase